MGTDGPRCAHCSVCAPHCAVCTFGLYSWWRRGQIVELNAFFLKDVLLVPPESSLNIYRLLVWGLVGVVAIRDYYHFTENPDVKR